MSLSNILAVRLVREPSSSSAFVAVFSSLVVMMLIFASLLVMCLPFLTTVPCYYV